MNPIIYKRSAYVDALSRRKHISMLLCAPRVGLRSAVVRSTRIF